MPVHTSLVIAEKYVPDEELLRVARAVIDAQDIREASWNEESEVYDKTEAHAVRLAVEKYKLDLFWLEVLTYWLVLSWNDVEDWASDIIKTIGRPI